MDMYVGVRAHTCTPRRKQCGGISRNSPAPISSPRDTGSRESKQGESKKLVPLTHRSSAEVPLWAGGFQGGF